MGGLTLNKDFIAFQSLVPGALGQLQLPPVTEGLGGIFP